MRGEVAVWGTALLLPIETEIFYTLSDKHLSFANHVKFIAAEDACKLTFTWGSAASLLLMNGLSIKEYAE